MALVQNQVGIRHDGLNRLHAIRHVSAAGLHLAIGREDGQVLGINLAVGNHVLHDGIGLATQLRNLVLAIRAIGHALVLVGHQYAQLVGAVAQHLAHADVGQVAHHVGVEVRLLGHKDRRQALVDGIANHASDNAALADTRLVANDKAAAMLGVVDGHGQRIDLLGREIALHGIDIHTDAAGDEFIQVAYFVFQSIQ